MRRLLLVLCAALVFASPAAAARDAVDRGLVARVRPSWFLLRELDGGRVRFEINRLTFVTLNGRCVRLARLQRGDVAMVLHDGQGTVFAVRAFRP